ncbi:MAG: HAMP domain-containing histidine kinase [Alphaproteobacteria bacterium]|nr:HAMP domain-containing histidine kinase [Alphaproteobacteria bacterium]
MTLLGRSLSAKLLMLTIIFVMIGEVLIYTPSIARYRIDYLKDRLDAAHLASLTVEAAPDGRVMDELTRRLLGHAGVLAVDLYRNDQVTHMLGEESGLPVALEVDLRSLPAPIAIFQAYGLLFDASPGFLAVTGVSPKNANVLVKIVIDQTDLRTGMIQYSYRILLLSIIISLITAALLYFALRWLMVRPIRRLTKTMVNFRRQPEDLVDMPQIDRTDEIGTAMREFRSMQHGIRAALRQKTRLATLGTAVSKISHDLRNMLATATLVSDRLAQSEDPQVKKVAPVLVRSIDRAASLCEETLNFTMETPPLTKTRFMLNDLVDEFVQESQTSGGPLTVVSKVPPGTMIAADRDQFSRILYNIRRNAANAGATELVVGAEASDDRLVIHLMDNGPGIPDHVREYLFQPFAPTATGGSGLGLAICRDLVIAHGGTIELAETGASGTHLQIVLPSKI